MLTLILACQSGTPDVPPAESLAPETAAAPEGKGTTMVAVNHPVQDQRIVELDADGEVVWSYTLPDELTFVGDGLPPGLLSSMEVLDDGNVLFAVLGVGIFETNRKNQLVWEHLDPGASHDVDRLESGNTLYARTWAAKGEPQVVEVDPDGDTVWSWTGLEDFDAHVVFGELRDEGEGWMHVNDVNRDADGRTMVVIRNFNKIVHIDPSGAIDDVFTFNAAGGPFGIKTKGPVDGERPHGVEFLGEHHFIAATRNPHRVVEVEGREIVWSYGNAAWPGLRDSDRLPNGNTLLVAAQDVVEIDADGRIVWQWGLGYEGLADDLNPICGASRIAADGTVLDQD